MATPVNETPQPNFNLTSVNTTIRSSQDETAIDYEDPERNYIDHDRNHLNISISNGNEDNINAEPSPSQTREQEHRLDDDLAMLQAERMVSNAKDSQRGEHLEHSTSMHRSRTRKSDPVDDFDVATNPLHEKTAVYRPPEHPSTNFAKLFKKIHNSSFIIRYFVYITPVVVILQVPLMLGALVFKTANVGGVSLMWFSIWLEIFWLTLWSGRIVAKMIPYPLGLIASIFTNNSKKWRDMGKQLEIPATVFFWWLAVEISFLPTMRGHHVPGYGDQEWENQMNKVLVAIFIGATLNFGEKIMIQLIAISFHLRTYADRIELNKFQIASLTKLYVYSKEMLAMEDSDFEEGGASGPASGARTPAQYLDKAQKNVSRAFNKVGDVAGKVAGDFTGHQVANSTHPHSVVLMLLNSTPGSQVLARRLFRTFVREESETVFSDDLKHAFDNDEEAEAAFTMFDKDLNGDISMEELESVCVEIGRERKSITASLKDLDSVVSKLDGILFFMVLIITVLVLITLISTSAAGVLTSAGSAVLALSWLFSATAQEFLQSIIFVFVKHPFDVGDRVSIYGNTGATMKGDDYFVKEISLLYTEFKKMEGHVVQAPNSYLNTLFILNMRRSGGLAEAIPLTVKFGTSLEQIDELRQRLLEFVRNEKREYQANILTEIRDVVEAHSVNLNVIFFYKSNWQNELLRLQRRNKFVCALMVSMQEIGIEGPRMRVPGQSEHAPFYQRMIPSQLTETSGDSNGGPGPHSGSLACEPAFVPNASDATGFRNQPSVRRHGTSNSRGSRTRGESVSAMAKRVDFSLGMRDVSSGDILGDLYDDRARPRILELTRSPPSRARNGSLIQDQSMGRSTSFDYDNGSRFGLGRSATNDSRKPRRNTSIVHRNRFFGRHDKQGSVEGDYEKLMEEGLADIQEKPDSSSRIDPRTGVISPQAVLQAQPAGGAGVNSGAGVADGPGPSPARPGNGWDESDAEGVSREPTRTRTENFEMKSMGK